MADDVFFRSSKSSVTLESLLREENYRLKRLASIPEMGLDLYSRCIVCRMNASGELESLRNKDFEIWDRYLAY